MKMYQPMKATAATTTARRMRPPFDFFRRRLPGGGAAGGSFLRGSGAGRTGGISGSIAWESSRVRVSLTLVVIGLYPLTSAQNEVKRLDSLTGGTVEFGDGFVEIHPPLQLDAARIFECHLTLQHQKGRRVSPVVLPHFAFVLLLAGATSIGRRPQTRLGRAHCLQGCPHIHFD